MGGVGLLTCQGFLVREACVSVLVRNTLTFLSVHFNRVIYVYIVGQWRSPAFKAKDLQIQRAKLIPKPLEQCCSTLVAH